MVWVGNIRDNSANKAQSQQKHNLVRKIEKERRFGYWRKRKHTQKQKKRGKDTSMINLISIKDKPKVTKPGVQKNWFSAERKGRNVL